MIVPPELAPETVEYLIVTTADMADEYQELANFKTREGVPARVTTVDWILANYHANDLASRIRAYIRDVYLYQGLRFVLLGGDTDQVPTAFVVARFGAPSGISLTTDKFYACLEAPEVKASGPQGEGRGWIEKG